MTKAAFALGLAFSALAGLPAVCAEQFQCPLLSNPNNRTKLEQIRGLLPDLNTMTNIEQLNATIASLRRGMTTQRVNTLMVRRRAFLKQRSVRSRRRSMPKQRRRTGRQ